MKERMDKECISICEALNRLPDVTTYESCSGHGKEPFNVWFRCDNIDTLSRLGRVVDKRYSDGNWEIVLDSCDRNPRGCFWLRTKSILPNDELYDSLTNLERSILYWFQDNFDKYFNQGMAIEQPDAELVKSIIDYTVGDWVVKKDGKPFYGGNYAEQITLIEVDEKGKRIWLSSTTYVHDDDIRFWSIADAEDGDVLVSGIDNPFIYDGNIEFSSAGAYVGVSRDGRIRLDMFPSKAWTSIKDVKPATKEQRDLLFKKMKEAGYEWDAEKKELRKIQPHYDISNFHAGMPVLVRDTNSRKWCYLLYSHYDNTYEDGLCFNAGSVDWRQCIPFEGNEHLLGTTNMCDEQYVNW